MKTDGAASRLMIFVGESDKFHHKPVYLEIVHRAHGAGLAGATVLRGLEGFGVSGQIHTSRILDLSEDLPMVILIVDAPEVINAFLPQLDDVIRQGLVVINDVDVVRYESES